MVIAFYFFSLFMNLCCSENKLHIFYEIKMHQFILSTQAVYQQLYKVLNDFLSTGKPLKNELIASSFIHFVA